MSVAATQRASPKRNTAQSSPMGTTSSGGGAGRRLERRPMRSNSFTQSSPKGPWKAKNRWRLLSIPPPSRLHLPYGGPQNVRFFPGVPSIQATPLLLGDPRIGVVGGAFEADLATRMAGEETDPCVELGIVGRAPGLHPGPPYNLRLDIEVGLFEGLAPRAKGEVLARLEHAARVFPEPHQRGGSSHSWKVTHLSPRCSLESWILPPSTETRDAYVALARRPPPGFSPTQVARRRCGAMSKPVSS